MRVKLSKKVCLEAAPKSPDRAEIYWDNAGSGLGVRVTELRGSGTRGRYFVFGYNTKVQAPLPGEPPRKSKWRIYQIGSVARWSLKQAQDEVAKLNAQVNDGRDPLAERRKLRHHTAQAVTVKDLAVSMMERHHGTTWKEPPPVGRKKTEPRYIREDRRRWVRWVLPKLGSKPVEEIVSEDIDAVLSTVTEQAGETAASRLRSMLSKAFNQAEKWKYRRQNSNPVEHSQKFTEKKRQRVLRRSELVSVVAATVSLLKDARNAEDTSRAQKLAVSKQRQLLVIQLAVETLRRPDELFKLEWDWINFEDRIVALPKTKADRKGQVIKGQTFGLSDRAVEILEQAKELAGESAYVFPSTRGNGPISTVRKVWAEILKRAGIKDKPDMYTLKHTMISLSGDAGVALGSVSDQVGHQDIRTTEIYRRENDRQKVETAETLSQYVKSLQPAERTPS